MQIRKRELLDNLQLLEKQADLKTMMEQIVDMTNQLNDLNPGKVKQEQATLIKRASDLNNQVNNNLKKQDECKKSKMH